MSAKPWENEPDEERSEVLSLRYAIIRHPSLKHLCGYVAVPPGHPLHGKHYDAVEAPESSPGVHGGLTYSGDRAPSDPDAGPDWWFGFDCAHHGDLVPGVLAVRAMPARSGEVYRDMAFVRAQIAVLATWLAASAAVENAP